jgi:hypothetical protein
MAFVLWKGNVALEMLGKRQRDLQVLWARISPGGNPETYQNEALSFPAFLCDLLFPLPSAP